jgi:O-antigen/teichoic acid export membrane protein
MSSQRTVDLNSARRDGTSYVVGGALLAALAAYVFQLVGGRALGTDEFAPITVLWTLQFLVFTIVLLPIEQLTVRRLGIDPAHPLRHDLPLIGSVVGVTAVLVTVVMYVAQDQQLGGESVHAFQAGLMVVGYGVFAFGRGRLGGKRQFRQYGLATAGESMLRLAIAIAVLAIAASAVGLGWSMVAAPWIILLFRPFAEGGEPRESVDAPSAGGFLAAFILGNAASHTILAAGPLVVAGLGGSAEAVSVFFVTLILVRAPLTLSYGLLSRLLQPMARLVAEGRAAVLASWAKRIVAVGVVMLIPAYIVGRVVVPPVVELLFGADFRPSSQLGGLITAGVTAAIASLVTSQTLIARGQTSRLAVAWIVGLAAAALAIAVGSSEPDIRVGIAFLVGQVVALIGVGVIAAVGTTSDAAEPGFADGPGPAQEIL